LDQFVEGSDIGELFDPSPSLVSLNFCLVARRVSLVVGVIFAQERYWSGPPLCDGHIALCLSHFGFVLQLRLRLGALEGDDLSLELVVELLQHLMFMIDVLTVESCLLPMAI